jgi:multiple sugar transport system permease protein
MRERARNIASGYLLVLPALVLLILILVYPLVEAVLLSLHEVKLASWNRQVFVGLRNYREIFRFQGPGFFSQVLPATLYFVGGSIVGQLGFGLAVALLVNQRWVKGKEIFRAVFILPWVTSAIVIAISWRFMYEPRLGVLNYVLALLGATELPAWLNDLNLVMPCLIVANVWHGTAFSFTLQTAGLQSIPFELHEAALVDGAGPGQRFLYITLPLIRPFVVINLVLISMYTVNFFDLIYAMTNGGPLYRTEVIAVFLYHQAFEFGHMGKGAAVAVLILLINLGLTAVYMRLNRGRAGRQRA